MADGPLRLPIQLDYQLLGGGIQVLDGNHEKPVVDFLDLSGENLMVKASSQPGETVPVCGETKKNPASILPVPALTIFQEQFILMVVVFLTLNLNTREVYVMVGRKLIFLDWISYLA